MSAIKDKTSVFVDELNGVFGVTLGQRVLVGRVFDDFFVSHQRYPVALAVACLDLVER